MIHIEEVLVTEAVDHRYYLNGEEVTYAFLIGLNIKTTGWNSWRVTLEKLAELPGVEIREIRLFKPLIKPSGSGSIPHTIGVDESFVYFREYSNGWPWKQWRVPILRRTKEFILLDILKKETQAYVRANGSYEDWKLEPGSPGDSYGH